MTSVFNSSSNANNSKEPKFKSKQERLNYLKEKFAEESRQNIQRATNITLSKSLVKYDTPFLVSSTATNKKTLEDLEENEEHASIYLRNIIHKGDDEELDTFEFSVKDALNKILPPKKITENEKIWVQYVTCTPVAKADVINLQEDLDRRLQTEQARETGICPIREQLYIECFDELIRQITLNCLERGILLMRIKKELNMTVESYQHLYESSIAYGIRTMLLAEEEKKKLNDNIYKTQCECDELQSQIDELENTINQRKLKDEADRKAITDKHNELIDSMRKTAKDFKDKIKDKLTFHNK